MEAVTNCLGVVLSNFLHGEDLPTMLETESTVGAACLECHTAVKRTLCLVRSHGYQERLPADVGRLNC